MTLSVYGEFSFADPYGFCVEIDILCMISILGMATEIFPAPGAWVVLLSAKDNFGFPTGSTVFSVAKAHHRF